MTSVVFYSTPSFAVCPEAKDGNSPISQQGLQTIASSALAAKSVDPVEKKSSASWFKTHVTVVVKVGAQTPNPNEGVENVLDPIIAKTSSSNPIVQQQAVQDSNVANDLYLTVSGQNANTPKTFKDSNTFLAGNKAVSEDAKSYFLNFSGDREFSNWGHGPKKYQTLDQDYSGFKLNDKTAGECYDQAKVDANWEVSLGYKYVGTFSSTFSGTGHVTSFFQDPRTGKIIVKDYYNQSESPSSTLSTSLLQNGRELDVISPGAVTDVATTTAHSRQYLMQDPRYAHFSEGMEKASDDSKRQTHITVEIGTLESQAAVNKMIEEGKFTKVTLFAAGGRNSQEGTYYHGEGGVRVDAHTDVQAGPVKISASSKNVVAAYDISDKCAEGYDFCKAGSTRNTNGIAANLEDDVHATTRLPSGAEVKVGVDGKGQEILSRPLTNPSGGTVYNLFKAYAKVGPIGIEQSAFIWTKQINEQPKSLHPETTSVSFEKEKSFNAGQTKISDKVSVYAFGNIEDGNTGERNTFKIEHTTGNQWKLAGSADLVKINHSSNIFIQDPLYFSTTGSVEKEFRLGLLQVSGRYNQTREPAFVLVPDLDANAGIERPRLSGSVNFKF